MKLPSEINAALTREARRAHKPKAALLRRAIEAYLEELADARAVEVARSQGGKPIPWAEVKRRQETAHLLRSPRNAARLRAAHEEIEKKIASRAATRRARRARRR